MATFSASDELVSFAAALNGQYDIEREIGRGGMGVVYLARDLRLDRMVAIKTLPPSLAGDVSVRERFLREARTAARLNHPNVVPIHRADEAGGQVFFVMGFVDGDSLAAKLASGPLAPREALPILRDVAQALGYAHRHGVIHRDVKTENILLDSVSGRAMVTDFGIARVAAAAPLTATGQVLGTVYYLSPEQVTDENVDARSDIYALGVVGFVMLSGRFPFDGNLASAVLISHVLRPAPPLRSLAPTVPAAVADIIDRCLAKNPAERFQSCAELDAALEAAKAAAQTAAVAAPASASPLVSDTEAQAILGRAAELQSKTEAQPLQPQRRRDAAADARRDDGFKTSVLRDAAAEAGIGATQMEQALAEHGLRPLPPRERRRDQRAVDRVIDLTRRGLVHGSEVHLEMVLNGEAPGDDYDLLVEIIRRHFPDDGMAGTIGRTLTWRGRTIRNRILEVSVQPRAGRTTLQVKESFKQIINSIWGLSIALIGFGGGGVLGANMNVGGDARGLIILGMIGLSGLIAAVGAKAFLEHREKDLRGLLQDLGDQARMSIHSARDE